ncbi:transglycosylase SLT domain-containing protein [Halorhodospira neutriphila]|uniref:transglycosylase SLT domain-containing protein n=1 Tax=Halorhodospira neutriphila TaxID=168379 RepID=UPI0019052C33
MATAEGWSRERLRRELAGLLREDFATAFERDPVAQQVERSLEKAPVEVERGELSRRPVLGAFLGGEEPPGPEEANRKAEELMASAKETGRERVEAGSGWARVISVPLPEASASEKASEYLAPARRYAQEQEVSESLVLAVMHTESSFNPMARSHIPAYGLMQIVPESAGRDATRLLTGRSRVLAPSYLYNPENNIRIGAAYLHLLYYRYMAKVRERESRLYCTIAGYNTGAGNVARTFTGDTNMAAAAERINGRSGGEVYRTLVRELPYEETKHYLERVARRIQAYRDL